MSSATAQKVTVKIADVSTATGQYAALTLCKDQATAATNSAAAASASAASASSYSAQAGIYAGAASTSASAAATSAASVSKGLDPGNIPANWMLGNLAYLDADPAAVTGPASSTSGRLASFNGTGGKIIQDSGYSASDFIAKSVVSNAGDILYGTAAGVVDNLPKGADGEILTLVSGLPSWEPAPSAGKWTALVSTTDFSTTAASTSTITMVTDQTATIKPGMAIRFTLSGTVYYAVCTAITSNLLTIAGAPLTTTASALTALSYGLLPPYVERIAIPGYWSDSADTALIASDLLTPYVWAGARAYLVRIRAYSRTVDSSASTYARVNARIGSTTTDYVSTSNSNAGLQLGTAATWVATTIDIATAKYLVALGDTVELKTDGNGGNDDSADLFVELTFVYE